LDGLQKGDDPHNIQLEIQALKLATVASEHQVRRAVAQAFMKRISQLAESGKSAKEAVAEVLPKYKLIIEKAVFDKRDSAKSDQVDFMQILQGDAISRKDGDTLLLHVATKLYELDVLEVEGVEQWWNDAKSAESEEMKRVREKSKQLVDFLLDDSDGEEDEEDEDDDDDEEEEDEDESDED